MHTQELKTKVSPRLKSSNWLDEDCSRRVRHEIFGENPYLARLLSVF
jgi:hypothetical protein